MVCSMLYYYYSVRQYVLSLLMSYLIEWDGVYLPCDTMKCLRCCMLYVVLLLLCTTVRIISTIEFGCTYQWVSQSVSQSAVSE